MTVTLPKRGTGLVISDYEEIFNIGKDWLLWSWRDIQGRWFDNKSECNKYIKFIIGLNKEA